MKDRNDMASSFDLVTLADLKTWLGVEGTQDDDLLSLLVSQVSRAILTFLDRPSILPTTYTDIIDGGNDTSVMLRYWPVNAIASCVVDGVAMPAAPPLVSGAPAQRGYILDSVDATPPGRMQRLSLRYGLFNQGLQNVIISYFAGYQVANEAAAIPSAAPFTIAAQAPYGAFASDGGVAYADGSFLTSVASNPSAGQYAVSAGLYTFATGDAGAAVTLTYGYIPHDLALAAKEWAAERYVYHARIGQASKSLGGQETVSFIVKDIPEFVACILQPYRRVVMP
ncbi:phage head-tail connector protein [Methyloferula stellata]|uniref:phage head-tail connector protein n=1 Tax=Methyloferula stellata TaxID=876270 RepID=UPI001FCBB101|nr:phage head-tail connector protein [Methyloferula stellata]